MQKKFFILLFLLIIFSNAKISFSEDIYSKEREALAMRVELTRLGSSGDPIEKEIILKNLIEECSGTEEAEAAYWDLADLYLDGFQEEKRDKAQEVLEEFLKKYPDSRWSMQVKFRLFDLYDSKNSRKAQLRNQILQDKSLPNILRSSLN